MHSSQRSRRDRDSQSPDRDRKRRREEKHGKDHGRDHAKEHSREHAKEHRKEDKRDKHEKRDKHDSYDRSDHRPRKDSNHDGSGQGEDRRRQSDKTPSKREEGRDAEKSSDRSRKQGNEDGKQSKGGTRQDAKPIVIDDVKDGKPDKPVAVDDEEIPPIEAGDSKMANNKNWREEMAGESGDERDLSDDEEATAKKLAESRKRREAAMQKWMNSDKPDEVDESQTKPPRKADDGAVESDHSDGEVLAPEKAEKTDVDEATRAQKQEVTKFILDARANKEKAEGGDMFDESADAQAKLNSGVRQSAAIGLTGASGDDWDDPDGYYIAKIGEVMDERYLVVENTCGKGVFSNVVKAKDQVDKETGMVAIKVMRANDMMKKAAEKEIEILEKLNNADKGNRRHVVRLLSTFYYRKHLCLVFECMWDDLRAALKKYTKGKGMAMQAVRAYSRQLMIGLRHMHKCGIIHADIKPDNILISEGQNIVKFCDLGTALEIKDAAVTPYLVSRFYRAPEIILGCEWNYAVDVFALGATLYELFTGKILLNSKTNNDALRKIMEVKGKIPKNIIKKGMLWKDHFDENLDFKYTDEDKYTREKVTRVMTDLNAKKDLFDMLMERVGPEKKNSTENEDTAAVKRAKQFADLLHQMLALDAEKRVTANDALGHQFLEEKNMKGEAKAGGGAAPKR